MLRGGGGKNTLDPPICGAPREDLLERERQGRQRLPPPGLGAARGAEELAL